MSAWPLARAGPAARRPRAGPPRVPRRRRPARARRPRLRRPLALLSSPRGRQTATASVGWRRGLAATAASVSPGSSVVVAPWTVAERGRARPLRADLDRRRPGALRRHLPALGRGPGKGRRRGGGRTPGALRPRRPPRTCGWSRSSPGSPPPPTRNWKPTRRSRGWAREQLWDDVSEEPLEYAGFVATKVGRIWSHGPRDVMREPVWEALHWALLVLGLLGLAVLAWRRRWEALVIGDRLPLDHRDQRPAGRLTAAGAGDAAAAGRLRRRRRGLARRSDVGRSACGLPRRGRRIRRLRPRR